MATGSFAVPTFRALLERSSRYPVLALFTRPEREAHTHNKIQPAAGFIRALAEDRGLPVFAPQSINAPEAQHELRRLLPDLLVVCDYGQILSRETLAVARLGGINLHGSLLPKYRGAAPVNWAIYHGETQTGVTVIHMTPRLDAGPCLLQKSTDIDPDETAIDLEPRLAELGAPAVLEAIDMLAGGRLASAVAQDSKLATSAPRLRKLDGLVDWTRSAQQIRNQVRAFQPWPTTYTFWRRPDAEPMRMILEEVATVSDQAIPSSFGANRRPTPGAAVAVRQDGFAIVCGQGAVLPHIVQPAGKRAMSIGEFLRGHKVQEGDTFGGYDAENR
jgi:methionyl-tRNA formyltransferase